MGIDDDILFPLPKGWRKDRKKSRNQVSVQPRLCEHILFSPVGEQEATRRRGGTHGAGQIGGGAIPRDWDEFQSIYGKLLVRAVQRAGVVDVGNAVGGLLETLYEADFLGTYDPRQAGFTHAFYTFIDPRIRGYRTRELRYAKLVDRCRKRGVVRDADESCRDLIELELVFKAIDPATTKGKVLRACFEVFLRTGEVRAADLAETLRVSPQMARRHLRSLDRQWVMSLVEGEE